MTKEAIIAEIKKHPLEEQQEIIEAIWDLSEEDYELTESQQAELQRRYEEFKKNPGQGSEWKDVRSRIEKALH